MFTKEMVDDYANKLLIGLTEEENKLVLEEFEQIDKDCDIVNKIEGISEIEPMTHCLDNYIVFLRDDEPTESVPIETAFSNCDDVIDDMIEVPKVVG